MLQSDGTLKTIRRRTGSIVFRSAQVLHRIDAVQGRCYTLFVTWKLAGVAQNWVLRRHQAVVAPAGYYDAPDGVYGTGAGRYRLRKNGFWFAEKIDLDSASNCDRLSIHQNLVEKELALVAPLKSKEQHD